MDLPQDPMMLFSVINMKLRDFYPSLDALCEDLNVDKEEIIQKLAAFGFEYSEENNKFWWGNSIYSHYIPFLNVILNVSEDELLRTLSEKSEYIN